ncbi:hypothetical protein ACFOQM_07795 [Paenibacillus sp. GCM10012307]|uniref:Uncharacterized protein n=1 Tax=Paenibacillus roseus TaxID=2798579 RepID=A0A934J6B4_9BACL|nr:hypothetical protein [Paenibacillus roseus]MBJ6361192.1 hypothetical protein [Paenibacillus roseus]
MNGEVRKFSRKAVWLAVDSEYGDRLMEITREHVALAKELIVNRESVTEPDREIYTACIEQLRQKRDSIISKFEGGNGND